MKVCTLCGKSYSSNDARTCKSDGTLLVEQPDTLINRTIAGRYTITKKIGEGGMGVVYRARQDVVDRDVAIKFLSGDLAHDPTNRKRFLREARAANRINHEHIIDITDLGETEDGLVFLVMEFLDGIPLSEAIARGPMHPRRAVGIALQMARALARAHELDVIHRDVKPDNVFLLAGYEGDFVKILDFGLAQIKGELRLTASGAMFGTPEYMSPEQARGQDATYAVDLYALGVVLFEMVTGELPFKGAIHEVLLKHLRDTPPPPSSRIKTIPPKLDALVVKLLAKQPNQRHLDAYHVAEELSALLETLPTSGRGSERPFALVVKETRSGDRDGSSVDTMTNPHRSGQQPMAAWADRVNVLDEMASRAHDGNRPEWLEQTFSALHDKVSRTQELRSEQERLAAEISTREQALRDARMRIGHALDQLAADESRVLRDLDSANRDLELGSGEHEELLAPLLSALNDLTNAVPVQLGPQGEPPDDALQMIADAGLLAQRYVDARRANKELPARISRMTNELSDLRFQIEQLKGRFGLLNAEQDLELSALRKKLVTNDVALKVCIAEILDGTRPVYQHLKSFPELSAEMRGRLALG